MLGITLDCYGATQPVMADLIERVGFTRKSGHCVSHRLSPWRVNKFPELLFRIRFLSDSCGDAQPTTAGHYYGTYIITEIFLRVRSCNPAGQIS